MGWKHDTRKGFGEGLAGIGSLAGLGTVSPWVMLILAFAVIVAGAIFWASLCIYGLTTAFFGFVGGALFLFVLSKVGVDLNKHKWFMVTPLLLGIAGYVVEKFGIWKIGLTVTLNTSPLEILGLPDEVTMGIETILIAVITFCCLADFIMAIKNKKR